MLPNSATQSVLVCDLVVMGPRGDKKLTPECNLNYFIKRMFYFI